MNKRILFLLLISSFHLRAQQTGSVSGTIYEAPQKYPVAGASVFLKHKKSVGTVSDAAGFYKLNLSDGKYEIVVAAFGLRNDTMLVEISNNSTIQKNFYLEKRFQSLETIVVTSGKFEQKLEDITVSMEVLKPKLIQHKNTTSIETALEQVPGLSIIDNDPQIRGGSGFTFGVGSRVAIVVDGIPLLSGDAGRPEWRYIPVENIEQIEIIKGASSVLYGSSALNGVIHVRSAYPRKTPKTQINFSTGRYSSGEAPAENWYKMDDQESWPAFCNLNLFHSRIIHEQLDFVIGANFNLDQGYIGPAPEQPALDSNIRKALLLTDTIPTFSNRDMKNLRGRINMNLRYRSKKHEGLSYGLNTNFMLHKTNMVFAWLDDSSGLYRAYPGALFLQNQVLFNIDPFVKLVSKNGWSHSFQGRVFYSKNDITNNQDNQGTMYFGEYQIQRNMAPLNLNMTGGVVGNVSYSQANIYTSSGQPDNQIVNASTFLQLDKKFWEFINISGGLRYEFFKMNDLEAVFKPIFRLGGNIKLSPGTFLHSSYGTGFRYPTITERYISTKAGMFGISPNPDLKPETSRSFELGLKQGFQLGHFKGLFNMAGFYQHYKNTIEFLFGVWDPEVSIVGFKFLNTGRSRVRGLDFSIAGSTPEKSIFGVTALVGYTYIEPVSLTPDSVYARDKSLGGFGQDLTYKNSSMDTTGNILKYRFKHMIKADLEFRFKKLTLGMSYRGYSKMHNIDKALENIEILTDGFYPNIYRIKAIDFWREKKFIHVFDCRLGYQLSNRHRLSLICNNIFNTAYALRPMKIESPRSTALQYVLSF